MLFLESIKLKTKVIDCEETSAHYKQTGIITFIEEKKGFKRSLVYYDITVKFEDGIEVVYKEWMLRDPLEVIEEYIPETTEDETEPTVTKRKKRQSAKRMHLTKDINRINILTVHSEHQTNQPKEITMNQNVATLASPEAIVAEAIATAAARGRPVDPSSAIHEAVNIVRGLPVADRKSAPTKALIQEKLGVKEGTAMVYYYNAIKALRESGEHPVKAVKAPKAKKVKAVVAAPAADAAPVTVVSANAPATPAVEA